MHRKVILGSMIAGFVLAIALLSLSETGLFTKWRELPQPAKPVSKILGLGVDQFKVYLQTESGETLVFDTFIDANQPNEWQPAATGSFQVYPENHNLPYKSFPAPCKVKQMYETDFHPTFESGGKVSIVLCADTRMMLWQHGAGGIGIVFAAILVPLFGAGVGALIGLVLTGLGVGGKVD